MVICHDMTDDRTWYNTCLSHAWLHLARAWSERFHSDSVYEPTFQFCFLVGHVLLLIPPGSGPIPRVIFYFIPQGYREVVSGVHKWSVRQDNEHACLVLSTTLLVDRLRAGVFGHSTYIRTEVRLHRLVLPHVFNFSSPQHQRFNSLVYISYNTHSTVQKMPLDTIYLTRHGVRPAHPSINPTNLTNDKHQHRLNYTIDPRTGTYKSAFPTPTGSPVDPCLTSHGVQQSHELAAHLAGESLHPKPGWIYSSPFYRCLQTIRPGVEKLRDGRDGDSGGGLDVRLENGIGYVFHSSSHYEIYIQKTEERKLIDMI